MSGRVSLYMFAMLFSFASCTENSTRVNTGSKDSLEVASDDTSSQVSEYSAQVVRNLDGSFGYIIEQNQTPIIHQDVIPSLPGNKGFADSLHALRIAHLVIYKLKNELFPPSVTREEINNILNQ